MLTAILASLVGLSSIGCASRSSRKILEPVDPPASFSRSGTASLPERWWTAFDDERLDAVVQRGLDSNFDLKTAWERLRAARAVVDRQSADLFPDLLGTAEAQVGSSQSELDDADDVRLGLSSSYEVDLWGRIRSSVDAERLRARATLAEYRTAALSLSAEITRTWYQLAEAREQLALVEEQVQTNEAIVGLLENRFGTGLIRGVDILRQRQLLESTREQRSVAASRIGVLEHRLAVLLGRPAQERVEPTASRLPALPPLPATGLPVDLIRRRPDVQRAFHLLEAADRDLATAITDQYPRLTLTASTSARSDDAGKLFREWALSFVGELVAPIFLGGELRAEVDRVEAVKNQRVYEYGQAVLTAFREVEDALLLEQEQRERIRSIEEQVELGGKAHEQLRIQFFHGMSDYLDALTALEELQELRRDLLSERLALVEARIALYRSLAGAFETQREAEEPSETDEVRRDGSGEAPRRTKKTPRGEEPARGA